MKCQHIALATLLLLVAGQANAQAVQSICSGVADNIFVTDITNCSAYYICINEQAIPQTCLYGLYFDAASQSCLSSNASCLNCDPSKLQMFPLAKTCNKYVLCFNGEPILQQCGDNLQFDARLGRCNFANVVNCVDNQCPLTNDANDIIHIRSLNNCSNYFICMNAQPWNFTCGPSLYFNDVTNSCDLPANVNCTNPSGKSRTHIFSDNLLATKPRYVNIDCPAEGIHFYPHSSTSKYYMCVHGKGALFTCTEGLYFDVKENSCRELKNLIVH